MTGWGLADRTTDGVPHKASVIEQVSAKDRLRFTRFPRCQASAPLVRQLGRVKGLWRPTVASDRFPPKVDARSTKQPSQEIFKGFARHRRLRDRRAITRAAKRESCHAAPPSF